MTEQTTALPPAEHQQAPRWPRGLNRDAMRADAAAVLSWLDQSATWTLLDQTVTPLLGRSPRQIASALFSTVIELEDPELFALAWLAIDHLGLYLEGRSGLPAPLEGDEPEALTAFRGAVTRAIFG